MALTNPLACLDSSHLSPPFPAGQRDAYYDYHQNGPREALTPHSPLFGVTPENEYTFEGGVRGVAVPLPHVHGHQEKDQFENGQGESPSPIAVPDILVDHLPCSIPLDLDDPLPLVSPSLSPEVLSSRELGLETEMSSSFVSADFNLFDQVIEPEYSSSRTTSIPPSTSFTPQFLPHGPLPPSTSNTTTLSHLQTRAVTFDRSLQSPLGDSPLVYASHSVSPQLSEGLWSPPLPSTNGHQHTVSPLLLDNLGLHHEGGGGIPANLFSNDPQSNSSTTNGLVSSYLSNSNSTRRQQENPSLKRNNEGRFEERKTACSFSPIMSQRTYENLFEDCVPSLVPPQPPSFSSLPPLPTVTSTLETYGEEEETEEAQEEEEEADDDVEDDEGDPEWVPPKIVTSLSTIQTRSTRPTLVNNDYSSSSETTKTKKNSKGGKRNRYVPPVLPLDAPIQPRKYQIDSRTSLKPIPKAISKRYPPLNVATPTTVTDENEGGTGGMSKDELVDEANRRRRMNTLSARESRKRKAEMVEGITRENGELKREVRELRGRIGDLERENEGLRRRIEGEDEEIGEGRKCALKRVRREY